MADSVKYTFGAGEIAPSQLGRSDTEAYDMAVAEAVNFFVDPRGGLSNRSGTSFKAAIYGGDNLEVDNGLDFIYPIRFIPFRFGPNDADSSVIVISPPPDGWTLGGTSVLRVMTAGEFEYGTFAVITAVSVGPNATVTLNPNPGWIVGQLVQLSIISGMDELNKQLVFLEPVGAGVYKMFDESHDPVDTTGFNPFVALGSARPIMTLDAPWGSDDRELIKYSQSRNVVYLSCPGGVDTYKLTRNSFGSWTLAAETYGHDIARPTNLVLTPSAAGTAGVAFCVTAVSAEGEESLPTLYSFNVLSVDYTSAAGSMRATWTGIAGAVYYKVYRSRVLNIGADISRAEQVGLVGIAYGPSFTDRNFIPDFTQTPPVAYNPFANGAIQVINVTAGGAGYTRASVVSASIGTGLIAQAIVDGTGVLLGIAIIRGGEDYTAASVVTVTVGVGATFTVEVTASSGNEPNTNAVHQQRKVYAGSQENPLRVVGSKPRLFANFDVSTLVLASDAYSFDIDAPEVAGIMHLNSTRSGLLAWSKSGLWELSGGNDAAITPTNVLADPQSFTGVQDNLPPLPIGPDFLYAEAKGNRVRYLQYTDRDKVFAGIDISQLANHLINPENRIRSWDLAGDPFNIVYAVLEDGSMLMLSLQKETGVYGWTRFITRGRILQVCVLNEDDTDVVYICVERKLSRTTMYTIETLTSRDFLSPDETQFLDCSMRSDVNLDGYPLIVFEDVEPGEATTLDTITSLSGAGLSVGTIIRGGGGKWYVTNPVTAPLQVICLAKPVKYATFDIQGDIQYIIPAFAWNYTVPHSNYSGSTALRSMWPFRGETVSVVADGKVQADKVVSSRGIVTYDESASMVTVGFLHYDYVKTLPAKIDGSTLEGRLRKVNRAALRLQDTRGIQTGRDLDHLFPFKEEQPVLNGEPIPLSQGVKVAILDTGFDYDGSFYLVQEYPMPVTILSFTASMEVGDAEDA